MAALAGADVTVVHVVHVVPRQTAGAGVDQGEPLRLARAALEASTGSVALHLACHSPITVVVARRP